MTIELDSVLRYAFTWLEILRVVLWISFVASRHLVTVKINTFYNRFTL